MTDQEARDNRARIDQSNEVAGIIITTTCQVHPDLFVTLDLRYRIADALWAAGYRKHPEPEAKLLEGRDSTDCTTPQCGYPEPHRLSDAELIDLWWKTCSDEWAIPEYLMVHFGRAVLRAAAITRGGTL